MCANQTRSLLTVQTPSVTTAFRSSTISPSSNLLNSPVQFRAFTDKAAKGTEVGEENADEETAEPNKSEEAAEEAIKKKMVKFVFFCLARCQYPSEQLKSAPQKRATFATQKFETHLFIIKLFKICFFANFSKKRLYLVLFHDTSFVARIVFSSRSFSLFFLRLFIVLSFFETHMFPPFHSFFFFL